MSRAPLPAPKAPILTYRAAAKPSASFLTTKVKAGIFSGRRKVQGTNRGRGSPAGGRPADGRQRAAPAGRRGGSRLRRAPAADPLETPRTQMPGAAAGSADLGGFPPLGGSCGSPLLELCKTFRRNGTSVVCAFRLLVPDVGFCSPHCIPTSSGPGTSHAALRSDENYAN